MAKPRLTAPILLGVVTVMALVLFTGNDRDKEKDAEQLRQTFEVGAVYYDGPGHVEVSYSDKSGKTDSVMLEVLGMSETFQKTFDDSQFTEYVPFPVLPQNGWQAHPIIFKVEHAELGQVQIKTEAHQPGEPVPKIIYSAGT